MARRLTTPPQRQGDWTDAEGGSVNRRFIRIDASDFTHASGTIDFRFGNANTSPTTCDLYCYTSMEQLFGHRAHYVSPSSALDASAAPYIFGLAANTSTASFDLPFSRMVTASNPENPGQVFSIAGTSNMPMPSYFSIQLSLQDGDVSYELTQRRARK